jgi:hypothetical protein
VCVRAPGRRAHPACRRYPADGRDDKFVSRQGDDIRWQSPFARKRESIHSRHSRKSGNPFRRRRSSESPHGRHSGESRNPFCFCSALVCGAVAKTDSRPCAFRPPSWRPSYFSLLVQREVTKRKTPSRSRSRGHPCPRDSASRLRGSPTARPCAGVELAGVLPAIAARLFLRLLAAAERGPVGAKRGSPCRRSKTRRSETRSKAPRTKFRRPRDCERSERTAELARRASAQRE